MQNYHQRVYKLALKWFKFWQMVTNAFELKKKKSLYSGSLTFLPILDNFLSIFLCFLQPESFMAEILKFSIKHPTDKVNAAVRKHSREEAE